MEFSFKRSAQLTGLILLLAAITQSIYTALYMAEASVPRQLLWGSEAILFTLLAAFAGSAMMQAKQHYLAWSALTASAALNVVQVSIGLALFGPFFEAAGQVEELMPAARSVVAFSFMVYNAAKVLLALALIQIALGRVSAGSTALGGIGAIVGLVALVSNIASTAAGRDVFGDLPLAGGSGVLATVLLALFLLTLSDEDAQ